MKLKPLLALAALAAVGLEATMGGCVVEEVEQPPTATPQHGTGTAAAGAITVAPTHAPAPTSDFVELDADGKYYIPDGGDGCYYVEVWRVELQGESWVGLQAPDCSEKGDLVWEFAPASEKLRPVLILQDPLLRETGPSPIPVPPSFFQQRPDGTYFRADAGDGCSYYEEVARYTRDGKDWIILQSPPCDLALLVALGTWDERLMFAYRPPDLSPPPTAPALRWPNPFPTAEDVQVGLEGKYIIRGRSDGCDYDEEQRSTRPEDGRLWVLLRSPECALVGLLVPGLQSDLEVIAMPTPPVPPTLGVAIERNPSPEEIRQDSEARYFIPDRGDRCVWIEEQRLTLIPLRGEERILVFLYSEECHPDFFFWYDPTDQRIFAWERYVPEGEAPPESLWPSPIALEDIQQDEAGKYSVSARADGCAYSELGRPTIDGEMWVMLSAPGCYILWRYAPATSELFAMDPLWWPIREMPAPSDFKLDSDGKYYLPDRGDGCPWREQNRFLDEFPNDEEHPQHLIVNIASDCGSGSSFYRYDVTAEELSGVTT